MRLEGDLDRGKPLNWEIDVIVLIMSRVKFIVRPVIVL
jgi:hypothetical protein